MSAITQKVSWWFLPGDGIDRAVITADIQRYLGPEATVKEGFGNDEHRGFRGYWISAYRCLTAAMIMDLRMDTERWRKIRPTQQTPLAALVTDKEPPIGSPLFAAHKADQCGWQIGTDRFLWNEEAATPLTITARGTLGRGAIGIVEEVTTNRQVAMVQKRIHIPRRRAQAERYQKMIEDEIENLKGLSHAHVITLIGCYQDRRGPYDLQFCVLMWPSADEDLSIFLEESYPNATLIDRVSTFNPWLKSWFLCLASALTYMHSKHTLHEDIKPNNIVHRGGEIYFTDFSSSRKIEDGQETSTSSPALATRLFAAPEALTDDEGITTRHGSGSDVYSLGLIFFEMLAVLHGHTVEGVRRLIFREKHTVRQYHRVINRHDFGAALFGSSPLAPLYTNCIRLMLLEGRKERPSASTVAMLVYQAKLVLSDCSCFRMLLDRSGVKEINSSPWQNHSHFTGRLP